MNTTHIKGKPTLDGLASKHTACDSFDAFCNLGSVQSYVPTFCGLRDAAEKSQLADAFDTEMERRGEARRAHRCHMPQEDS